jgi:esterase/lipase
MEEIPLARLPKGKTPPALVLGATKDTVVDKEDCEILASYYNTHAKMLGPSGHDVMLDIQWQRFADELLNFVKSLSP